MILIEFDFNDENKNLTQNFGPSPREYFNHDLRKGSKYLKYALTARCFRLRLLTSLHTYRVMKDSLLLFLSNLCLLQINDKTKNKKKLVRVNSSSMEPLTNFPINKQTIPNENS